ncbi:hypothetical protein GEMRC1_010584 [Eukaryota sp. GEM-RC1]
MDFLKALRGLFGFGSIIQVFHTHSQNPKGLPPFEAWQRVCSREGVHLIPSQHIGIKESADIQMYSIIFADVLRCAEEERKKMTVVIASADSDFYDVVESLQKFVKVVVCGRDGPKGTSDVLKNATRYISTDILLSREKLEDLSVAKTFVTGVLQRLQNDLLLSVSDIDECLAKADTQYWPLLYGCQSTADLLTNLGLHIESHTSVHQLLQDLDRQSSLQTRHGESRYLPKKSKSPSTKPSYVNTDVVPIVEKSATPYGYPLEPSQNVDTQFFLNVHPKQHVNVPSRTRSPRNKSPQSKSSPKSPRNKSPSAKPSYLNTDVVPIVEKSATPYGYPLEPSQNVDTQFFQMYSQNNM